MCQWQCRFFCIFSTCWLNVKPEQNDVMQQVRPSRCASITMLCSTWMLVWVSAGVAFSCQSHAAHMLAYIRFFFFVYCYPVAVPQNRAFLCQLNLAWIWHFCNVQLGWVVNKMHLWDVSQLFEVSFVTIACTYVCLPNKRITYILHFT